MSLCFISPVDPSGSQIGWHPGSFRRPAVERSLVDRFRETPPSRADQPGYDFMADAGAPVLAGLPGIVEEVGRSDRRFPYEAVVAPGHFVTIRTDRSGDRPIWTTYSHLREAPRARAGQTVATGDLLGFVGSSGLPAGSRAHLMVTFSHFGPELTNPTLRNPAQLGFSVEGAQPPPVRAGSWTSTPAFGGRLVSSCGASLGWLGAPPRLNNYTRYGTTRLSNASPYDPTGSPRTSSGGLGVAAVVILLVGGAIVASRSS